MPHTAPRVLIGHESAIVSVAVIAVCESIHFGHSAILAISGDFRAEKPISARTLRAHKVGRCSQGEYTEAAECNGNSTQGSGPSRVDRPWT
jgi:hypothetical protein